MSLQSGRPRVPSVALFVVMFLVLSVTALYAATPSTTAAAASARTNATDDGAPAAAQPATLASAAASPTDESAPAQPLPLFAPKPVLATHRPAALIPLYVSFATLQALDARSTVSALAKGATEANPLLGGVTEHTGAFLALKMGAAASTVFLTEKLWKRNPVAAVALMVGLNSAYAIIVAHNYGVARGLR